MRRLAGDASRKQSQVDGVKEQFLLGRVDESPPMSSRARAQPKQSQSSGGEAGKAMLRVKAAVDACRFDIRVM